ncbi:Carboxylesterase [Mycena capillaripes]|nr:Carboxylesterase [Mycena capillaripes]
MLLRNLVLLFPLAALSTLATPIVDLGYAQYQGAVDTTTNVTTFLGIRYAAAPIAESECRPDNLRFRAPQPPKVVPGVQQATEQPDQCFQTISLLVSPTNSLRQREATNISWEDCLFLSVSYPSDAVGVPVGGLPTLVYIHGGGHVLYDLLGHQVVTNVWTRYTMGSSSQFRGTDLIAQSNRGIVTVIIQYRLGLFGFLSGAEVKKNGKLNTGLLDQELSVVNVHVTINAKPIQDLKFWRRSCTSHDLGGKRRLVLKM